MRKEDFTGSMGYVMAIDLTLKEAPIAEIKVDTPYYTGVTQAICLRDPLFDLVIGNIPGARTPDDPVPSVETCAATVTRAQARKDITVKPLVTKEVTTQASITKNELAKLQQEDTTLEKYAYLADAVRRGDYEIKYERRRGVLYRIRNRVDGLGECSKQIMVPKILRRKVMEVAHDSIFGGHLGIKRTKDRSQTNFYWPGMQGDITSFCRSCDVCQKTTAKGSVPRVPVGDMPLIDMPFRRVAVDLVGPISPPSEKGHRYILTLVDYATRYPEAVPLKNIETETMAEALMDRYSRLGIPEEVLSDLGTQFVSKCMDKVSRLLSIKRLTTTTYHPICNGLVERFNDTLKKMLRRLCNEQPRQWHRFVNPLLFAYREAPQEATGFSPFELLYGRTVRGPEQILKELWTGETGGTEVKTSYQYVFEWRERLNNTMKIAQEELLKSRKKNKTLYDRRANRREFQEGDKVLLLLPTDTNKLLMQWKGPYEILSRCGKGIDYRIEVNKKVKTLHANMLKKYIERDHQDGAPQQNSDNKQVVSCDACTGIIGGDEDLSVNDEEMMELANCHQKETVKDVKLGIELTKTQQEETMDTLVRYAEDSFQRLGKSKYYSKIDVSKGYWQIPVAEEDIKKTAFITPDGTYDFFRMPFGMKNSGATLVRGMRKILAGMNNVDSYIDDLIIHTNDWQAHLQVLGGLLRRLREAGLRVRPSKCVFGAESVEFLGHYIGRDWITINEDNLEKIRTRRPTTKKEVRSFLGLANYYRAHIPTFAAVAAPLTDLTRKGQPNKIRWGQAQEKAFSSLQDCLLKRPILRLPDHSKPFILRTDASNFGLGAALMQQHEEKLYPVAYASKKLAPAETRYSTLEKECLGIVWGVTRFRLYLAGKPFILQTNHQPLAYINKTKYQNDRTMRWALALQGYYYTVQDIPGKDNVAADYLSRVMD